MSPQGPARRARHRRAEPVPDARRRPGCTHSLTGARLVPIGTVYDPFVNRGLDALIYACYQDARFLLVSTPSGITLAPEGGQHQSVNTPLIGMAADRLASYEPAYVDELAILLAHAFRHMQAPDGSAVWLRLSTRGLTPADGPHARSAGVIAGAHWVVPPAAGRADRAGLSGADRAGSRGGLCDAAGGGAGRLACWPSPAPTGCTPAGSRRPAPGAAGDRAARFRHIETILAPLAPRCGAGHHARRTPGGACLARRGARPARGAAGGGSLSGKAGIFRICIAFTGSMRMRSWMPVRRRCWGREGKARALPLDPPGRSASLDRIFHQGSRGAAAPRE